LFKFNNKYKETASNTELTMDIEVEILKYTVKFTV